MHKYQNPTPFTIWQFAALQSCYWGNNSPDTHQSNQILLSLLGDGDYKRAFDDAYKAVFEDYSWITPSFQIENPRNGIITDVIIREDSFICVSYVPERHEYANVWEKGVENDKGINTFLNKKGFVLVKHWWASTDMMNQILEMGNFVAANFPHTYSIARFFEEKTGKMGVLGTYEIL